MKSIRLIINRLDTYRKYLTVTQVELLEEIYSSNFFTEVSLYPQTTHVVGGASGLASTNDWLAALFVEDKKRVLNILKEFR
jgi:hypothetical protein